MFASVGITTVDLFNSGIDKMPDFGGNEFTVNNLAFCDNPLRMVLGGNGAITAYVLARLGATSLLCSAVGHDQLGALAEGWLQEAGVETAALIHVPNGATPTTTVIDLISDVHRDTTETQIRVRDNLDVTGTATPTGVIFVSDLFSGTWLRNANGDNALEFALPL